MKNRFDLETDITALYSSAEDLKTVVQMMYDSDFIYDKDRTWNALYGLAEVMEAKIGKLEDTFSQVFQLDQYAPEEIKLARDSYFAVAKAYQEALNSVTPEEWDEYDQRTEGM